MVTTIGSLIQGKTVHVTEAGLVTAAITLGVGDPYVGTQTPSTDGTAVLSTTVPADGAELVEATFTITSPGTGTHTQQWSIADPTNALATLAALTATGAAGTVVALTMASVANGKAVATTSGAALTLTNTSVGTSTEGMNGTFRLVWAL